VVTINLPGSTDPHDLATDRHFAMNLARGVQVLRIRIVEELGRVCSASASIVTGADLSCRAIVAGASDDA
jgi:hypothetical protein